MLFLAILTFELLKKRSRKRKNTVIGDANPTWLYVLDEVRAYVVKILFKSKGGSIQPPPFLYALVHVDPHEQEANQVCSYSDVNHLILF